MDKDGNIKELQELAQSRGGKCLSSEYVTNRIHLQWECGNGHVWLARPTNIRTGTWCPVCASNIKLTIEEMQKMAEARGGKCLSTEYINNSTKLKWQCKDGHIWEKTPSHIRDRGQWCPECYKKKQQKFSNELLISKLQDLSKELGRIPKISDIRNRKDFPDNTTYRDHFGSWAKAIELAFNISWRCQDCGVDITKRAIKSKRCVKCSKAHALLLKREHRRNNADQINRKRREDYKSEKEQAKQLNDVDANKNEESAENIFEKFMNVLGNIGKA